MSVSKQLSDGEILKSWAGEELQRVEAELSQSQAGMGELLRYRRALEIIRDESLSEEAVKAIAEFALVGVI